MVFNFLDSLFLELETGFGSKNQHNGLAGTQSIDYNLAFNEKLREFEKNGYRLKERSDCFSCGYPGEILVGCGLYPNHEILIMQSTLRKALGLKKGKADEAHDLTTEELYNLPQRVQNPILVISGNTHSSRLIFIDIQRKGRMVLAAMQLQRQSERGKYHAVVSIYSKPVGSVAKLIEEAIAKNSIWHVDRVKIKGFLSVTGQLQLLPRIIESLNGANIAINNSESNTLPSKNYSKNLSTFHESISTVEPLEKIDRHKGTELNRGMDGVGLMRANKQFNHELILLFQRKLPKNHIFMLGKPGKKLIEAGIPNFEIELLASILLKKSNQVEHQFNLSDLKNLPIMLQNPVAVFSGATQLGAFVVMLENEKKGEPFFVAMHVKSFTNNHVNSIRAIHYRKATHIINWIIKKRILWVDKEKALNWIFKQRYNSADVGYRIKGAARIIKNFDIANNSGQNLTGASAFGLINFAGKHHAQTYTLKGELGRFLGDYERNRYSIVIRGDKGAGKSRLLYQLINAFAGKRYRVAFLSLEMGIHSAITQRYKSEYISPANLKRIDITDNIPDYESLNAICKMYDVVAIDSWNKLKGIDQSDFDRLQKENPHTIIISIFQSTTSKVTRGGNMPEYDSSVVIHVHEGGIAECEKNRFAPNTYTYNVFTQKLTKSEVIKND